MIGRKSTILLTHTFSVVALLILILFLPNCAIIPELNTVRIDKIARGPEFAPYSGIRKRVAVLDFENVSGFGTEKFGSAIADMLVSRLARSGRFILIERSSIQQILREQALGQSGVITEESAPQVGKLLGVETLVMGKIIYAGQQTGGGKIKNDEDKWKFALKATVGFVTISYRMVSVETGEVIFADNVSEKEIRPGIGLQTKDYDFDTMFDFDETVVGIAVQKAINKIALKIASYADAIQWVGTVIQTKNDSIVYFKPGVASGIKRGQIFNVFDANPLAGRPKARIKATGFIGDKVTRARLVIGSNVARGDRVKLLSVSKQ
ncbi:hypothetical protein B6D60_04815 [candidate division KSB1 bacterium 4484_87]|nr:MAG: hypothetical protein B6D60_04815 [candidate division KSB1 bacterium 4484_87]